MEGGGAKVAKAVAEGAVLDELVAESRAPEPLRQRRVPRLHQARLPPLRPRQGAAARQGHPVRSHRTAAPRTASGSLRSDQFRVGRGRLEHLADDLHARRLRRTNSVSSAARTTSRPNSPNRNPPCPRPTRRSTSTGSATPSTRWRTRCGAASEGLGFSAHLISGGSGDLVAFDEPSPARMFSYRGALDFVNRLAATVPLQVKVLPHGKACRCRPTRPPARPAWTCAPRSDGRGTDRTCWCGSSASS
jgi:hypothetical protein